MEYHASLTHDTIPQQKTQKYRCVATVAGRAGGVDMQFTRVRIAAGIFAMLRQPAIAFFTGFDKHVATFRAFEQTGTKYQY